MREQHLEDAGDAHHVEGIRGPVMEALEEEEEAEDRSHTEQGEEPTALAEGVHQEALTNTTIGPEKAMAL